LKTTADTLVLVGGESDESLTKKILQLKIAAFKGRSAKHVLPKSLEHFKLGHLEPLMIRLRFVRAKRMVWNNHRPFHKTDKAFFQPFPDDHLPSIDAMLHHIHPGFSSSRFFKLYFLEQRFSTQIIISYF
jgi:hypothetical protein